MLANQKQLGAYYTQEDIAEYIGRYTLIPFLLDAVEQQCPTAFAPNGPVWSLLRENPDHYCYDALRKGCALPLPPQIEAGIEDLTRRHMWSESAPDEYALPLETWREVIARRQRYAELKKRLSNGEICAVYELITCNLAIRRFAQDVITRCASADLLGSFYENLECMTILDPACGSGAFLLAALDVLEPLYTACLERMQSMIEQETSGAKACLPANEPTLSWLNTFREILCRVNQYPDRRSFVLQTIVTRNLYGVDIMQEAVESCRAALALRLAPQAGNLEALPEITFNIRTGNALVGFVTFEHVPDLANRPRNELDSRLAAEYGLKEESDGKAAYAEDFARWRASHQPFHWCLEFREVMRNGGFAVIIGNPPYVAYRQVRETYQISSSYATYACGNLCAVMLERALALLRPHGRCGMIVPVSAIASEYYQPLSELLFQRQVWVSSYASRPHKLFADVEQRLAILLIKDAQPPVLFSSSYRRWYREERAHLFTTLSYARTSIWSRTGMPLKSGSEVAEAIFARLSRYQGFPLLHCLHASAFVWVHNGPTYWVRALPFEPNVGYKSSRSNHYHKIPVHSQSDAFLLSAILSSSTFYFFYTLVSNCRDLGRKELQRFPLGELPPALKTQLIHLGRLLADRLKNTAVQCMRCYPSGKITYEEYDPAQAKLILDEIDRVLAMRYGLSAEELDFIINYDLKYRMGRERD